MSESKNTPQETEQKPVTESGDSSDRSDSEGEKKTGKVDLLLADVFHVASDNVERVAWGKLDVETRVQKLREYFEREFNNETTDKTIAKSTITMLLDRAQRGELHLKKEVSYDEINQRVIKLSVLTVQPHTDNYVYKPEKMSRREKSRKSAKARLFRKKR